jgi:CRISPR-associated protein Csd1
MLMQRLVEFAGRLSLPPPMYDKIPIRWIIDLDAAGVLRGVTQTASGKKNDRGKEFLAPTLVRSVGIKAKLLCDNAEYTLGIPREGAEPERVAQCHEAYKNLVQRCAKNTGESSVHAAARFLTGLKVDQLPLPQGFSPGDTVTFRVEGTLPIELPSVQRFWAEETGAAAAAGGGFSCLACGSPCEPTDRMPVKIKRIPGGQTSGTTIVSANAAAFESFGLEASRTSPLCRNCAELHAKGLNDLLEKQSTRIFLGPTAYVFWTREEVGLNVASLLSDPQPEEVKRFLASAITGAEAGTDVTAFYAAAFSASGGRVVVRDWLETTLGHARSNLSRWFMLQKLVESDGSEGRPIGLFPLASSLVRDARKDLSPNTPKVLLRTALHGGPLPSGLLFEAVKRNRAEQALTRPRAALIKMVFLSQLNDFEEGYMEKLDLENKSPAYLCGRLLAELEALQYAALGKTNTTVTGRFYGTASSAPASVFGRLMRGAQAHLAKLRTAKPGTHEALQQKLEEIQSGLASYPLVLTLEEQGLFALGYYHQRAQDRADRKDYAEAKRAEAAETEE